MENIFFFGDRHRARPSFRTNGHRKDSLSLTHSSNLYSALSLKESLTRFFCAQLLLSSSKKARLNWIRFLLNLMFIWLYQSRNPKKFTYDVVYRDFGSFSKIPTSSLSLQPNHWPHTSCAPFFCSITYTLSLLCIQQLIAEICLLGHANKFSDLVRHWKCKLTWWVIFQYHRPILQNSFIQVYFLLQPSVTNCSQR